MAKRRNPVVKHATILRKGGVHQLSKTGKRYRQRQEIDNEVDLYFEQQTSNKSGAASDCPDHFLTLQSAIYLSGTYS